MLIEVFDIDIPPHWTTIAIDRDRVFDHSNAIHDWMEGDDPTGQWCWSNSGCALDAHVMFAFSQVNTAMMFKLRFG